MFNNVQSAHNLLETVMNAFEGNVLFLNRLKGETVNSKTDLFIFNSLDIVADKLEPDAVVPYLSGQSSSESQVTVALGFLYAYTATGDVKHLNRAISLTMAYLQNFYPAGAVDRTDPGLPNWAINGKEPIMAHYPINDRDPRFSGYKSVPVRIVNGVTKLPSGSPKWGNFLDIVTFAHRGHMETENIDGKVKDILDTVDWDVVYNYYLIDNPTDLTNSRAWINWNGYLNNVDGYRLDWSTKYINTERVEHFINWEGRDVTPEGKLWSDKITPDDAGTVYFANHNLNGVYLLNYAVKLPIGNGGRWINRNLPWDSSPLLVPLDPTKADKYYNNGIDVEQITVELMWLLYTFTGEEKYKNWLSIFSNRLFKSLNVSADDFFFRASSEQTVPFIDGKVIDTSEPANLRTRYDRDEFGNIQVTTYVPFKLVWDQQEMWYRVNRLSHLVTTYSGRCVNGSAVDIKCNVSIGLDKTSSVNDVKYVLDLPNNLGAVKTVNVPFTALRAVINPKTKLPYLITDKEALQASGSYQYLYQDIILGGSGKYFALAKGSHTLTGSHEFRLDSLVYKANEETTLTVSDGTNEWTLKLPAQPSWINYKLDKTKFVNKSGLGYTNPLITSFKLESTADINLWCVNDLPEYFNSDDGYTFNYTLSFVGNDAATLLVGDCYVDSQRLDQLPYTPGVFPFIGPNELQIRRIPLLKGQPYPSHQYPLIYLINGGMETEMNNVINFWFDSQTAYHAKFGIYGPGMAAFSWGRWDNTQFTPSDTWTMMHWGVYVPWSGYHVRPFYNASKLAYELKRAKKTIPAKLSLYLQRWTGYITQYIMEHDSLPNVFPNDGIPYTDASLGFKPNEIGTWLSALSYSYLSGINVEKVIYCTNFIFHILLERYNVLDVNSLMNGSWSESVSGRKLSALDVGEILKALSLYALVQELAPGQDIYARLQGKYTYIPDPNISHVLNNAPSKSYLLDENGDQYILEGYKNG